MRPFSSSFLALMHFYRCVVDCKLRKLVCRHQFLSAVLVLAALFTRKKHGEIETKKS
jgi:hypothetical protein